MAAKRKYLLTETAVRNFIEAKHWSKKRWGTKLTTAYFKAIENCANDLADRGFTLTTSEEMTSSKELLVWPVKEHYLVYLPVRKGLIIIVALIRQSRDVPSIVASNSFSIQRNVRDIYGLLESGDISLE